MHGSSRRAINTYWIRWGSPTCWAESLDKLNPSTEALDLHHSLPDSLPEDIGRFSGLKIILIYGKYADNTRIESPRNAIGKLTKLPESIGQLRQLRILDLSVNRLSELPESIGWIKPIANA